MSQHALIPHRRTLGLLRKLVRTARRLKAQERDLAKNQEQVHAGPEPIEGHIENFEQVELVESHVVAEVEPQRDLALSAQGAEREKPGAVIHADFGNNIADQWTNAVIHTAQQVKDANELAASIMRFKLMQAMSDQQSGLLEFHARMSELGLIALGCKPNQQGMLRQGNGRAVR